MVPGKTFSEFTVFNFRRYRNSPAQYTTHDTYTGIRDFEIFSSFENYTLSETIKRKEIPSIEGKT